MPSLKCTNSRCTWVTDDVSEAMAYSLVKLHLQSEHKLDVDSKTEGTTKARMDKLKRPEVSPEMSNDRWAYFLTRWESYKVGCGLTAQDVLGQLKECMVDSVREDH